MRSSNARRCSSSVSSVLRFTAKLAMCFTPKMSEIARKRKSRITGIAGFIGRSPRLQLYELPVTFFYSFDDTGRFPFCPACFCSVRAKSRERLPQSGARCLTPSNLLRQPFQLLPPLDLNDSCRAGLGVDIDNDYRGHALVAFVSAGRVDAESVIDHLFTTHAVHVTEYMEDR